MADCFRSMFSFKPSSLATLMRSAKWLAPFLAVLVLVLAHGMALVYRVQPQVSLWFPPAGVAIAVTLWFGPIGALLAGIVSMIMAPLWGIHGWMRMWGLLDSAEPLIAWFLYRQVLCGSLTLHTLRSVIAFLLSAPLTACFLSALLGCFIQIQFNLIPTTEFLILVSHWWVGNAIGTMTITPIALLVGTPLLRHWRWLSHSCNEPPTQPSFTWERNRWLELIAILVSVSVIGLTTVQATFTSLFVTLQFSLLSIIPIIWAACRFGGVGGAFTATFTVLVTLFAYVLFYPGAIALSQFPVDPQLLHLHKLNLLLQTIVALVVGTAITEWSAGQVALAVEQVRLKEYEAHAQLSEKLFQVNRLLTQAQKDLDRRHQEFTALVENSTDIISRFDRDSRYLYINPSIEAMTGIAAADFIGKTLAEIGMPPERRDIWEPALQMVLQTGEPRTIEFEFPHINGNQHTYQTQLIPEFGSDGLIHSILTVSRDITTLKQTELQLRQRQRFIERVTDTVPGILYVYDLIEKRNVYANLQLIETLGYTPAEIQSMGDNFFPQLMHPDDLARLPGQIEQMDRLKDGETLEFEFRMRHTNGDWRWLLDRTTIFTRTPDGQPHQLLGCAQDITARKCAELALRDVNERFQLASAAISSLVYDWQIDIDHVQRSDGLLNLLGYSPDEVPPQNSWWQDQIHPSDLAQRPKSLPNRMFQNNRYTLEYRIRHKQGHYVMVQDSGLILRDAAGNPVRLIGNVIDISDRKQSENALRESEERLRLALVAANQGLYDLNVQTGTAIVSPEYALMMGYDPETFEETHENWLDRLHPDDRPATHQIFIDYKIGKRSDYRVEFRQRTQTGEWKWILSVGKIVEWDEAGQPLRMLGTHTDITDRKKSEAALQRSQERLNLALEAAGMGIWKWNIPANEVSWSVKLEEMFGLSPNTFDGGLQTFLDRLHPDDRNLVMQTSTRAIYAGTDFSVEFRIIKLDQTVCWLIARGKVFLDRDGSPLQMTGVTLDITDRKRIEAERAAILQREQAARHQAEAASRMKDEFLAIVSHELRSPLNAILGWSRLLRTRKFNPEKTELALATIERNAQAQTQLIEDLLDISRIIRGKIRIYPRSVDLGSIVQAAIDTTRPAADSKSIQINTQFGERPYLVMGDPDRLQQIVWNLLSNAVKFTPQAGQVTVKLVCVAACDQSDSAALPPAATIPKVQIIVIDTGKGIDPAFLPQVFDRFTQADSTTTRQEGGLGLGLAIVRSLVELHGGSVKVDSLGLGQGATFTVELPLLPDPTDPVNSPDLDRAYLFATDSLKGIKVLVVDDEADTRDFLVAALEQFGATATAVGSVEEAFSQISQFRPQVVLSDIGMPDQDGYDFIQKLRSLSPEMGGQIPAAALTAYVRGDDRNRAIEAGFQLHIPKPIEPSQLITVVKQLVSQSRSNLVS